MIGIDWGTTSFRAYRFADGQLRDRIDARTGIMNVPDGDFAAALRQAIGPWLDAGERRVLLAGMIGSRQGWIEAPYLPCPASTSALAASLVPVPFDGAEILLVPGVTAEAGGVPEVMRGEETQILGALPTIGARATVCMPGTHAKWVEIADGRILGFRTFMTGEVFAALGQHTILARLLEPQGGAAAPDAFAAGVRRSAEPGGLLHHLFGVRTLPLTGRLSGEAASAYLSGLLLGHEVRAALALHGTGHPVFLIGAPALCARYADAISLCGGEACFVEGEPAAAGLAAIAQSAAWRGSEET